MVNLKIMDSRNEWLKGRGLRIGGSEAACLLGLNPWKTNVQLFREKTGLVEKDDISDNEAVAFGTKAEAPLRELFKLSHPELEVSYVQNNLWTNDEIPFAHGSLDGWIKDENGEEGLLEIKTTSIRSGIQTRQWHNKIPDHYYCQVQWYLMVTGFKFAWLCCLQRRAMPYGCDLEQSIRSYYIHRDDESILLLRDAGALFYRAMEAGKEPALILPDV